jgi:hypothetical protein
MRPAQRPATDSARSESQRTLAMLAHLAIFSVGRFLRKSATCRPHRRGRLQTKVGPLGHVGPLPRRRHNAVQDTMLPQSLRPAEKRGRHWVGPLGPLKYTCCSVVVILLRRSVLSECDDSRLSPSRGQLGHVGPLGPVQILNTRRLPP